MSGDPIADGGDGDRPTQSRQFTADLAGDELPSHAVVRAVAAISNESPLDLDPLYGAIDPDRLNELFAGPDRGGDPDGESRPRGSDGPEVAFTFSGFEVTVTDGTVTVRETDGGD